MLQVLNGPAGVLSIYACVDGDAQIADILRFASLRFAELVVHCVRQCYLSTPLPFTTD